MLDDSQVSFRRRLRTSATGIFVIAMLQGCVTAPAPAPVPLAATHPAAAIQVIKGGTNRRYEYLETISTSCCMSLKLCQVAAKNHVMIEGHELGADAIVYYLCRGTGGRMWPGPPVIPMPCLECSGLAVKWY